LKVEEDFRKEEFIWSPKTKRQKKINHGAEGGISTPTGTTPH